MTRNMSHAVCLAFLTLIFLNAPVTADVMLDDFTTGTHSMTTTPFDGANSAQYDTQVTSGGAAGPLRLIDHTVGTDGNGSLQTQITGGDLDVSVTTTANGSFLHGIFQDTTGIPASGSGNVDSTNLVPLSPTLDLSGETELEIEYTYSGGAFSAVVQVFAFGDPLSQTDFDQTTILILESGTNTISVDTASFFSNVDASQIGAIGFTFVSFGDCDVQFHRFEAVGGITDPPTTADSYTIERGNYISGDVTDTHASDNSYLTIQRQTGLSRTDPITIDFDGQLSSDSPASLALTVEAKSSALRINQKVAMWNWSLAQFDPIDSDQTNQTDQVFTIPVTGNFLNYVEPGTGNVRVRLGYRPAPRAVVRGYTVDIDHLFWQE